MQVGEEVWRNPTRGLVVLSLSLGHVGCWITKSLQKEGIYCSVIGIFLVQPASLELTTLIHTDFQSKAIYIYCNIMFDFW